MADIAKIKEERILALKEHIESSDRELAWLNKRIAEQREEDRKMVEYVWSQGVVDKVEMEVFTKGFKSKMTKELLKQRAREYRWRSDIRNMMKDWENL